MAIKSTTSRALNQLEELKKFGKPERLAADDWPQEWQTLIAILMSARTRDDVTIIVGERLFAKYKTIEELANAPIEQIEQTVKSINFFRNKAKNIKACATGIVDLFGGKLPHDSEELIKLAGVGRKTANVFLAEHGHPAIGVDTHVHQVANALGWSDAKTPDKIEIDLMKLFPKEKWNEVNDACVHFGRTNQAKSKKQEIYEHLRKIS